MSPPLVNSVKEAPTLSTTQSFPHVLCQTVTFQVVRVLEGDATHVTVPPFSGVMVAKVTLQGLGAPK